MDVYEAPKEEDHVDDHADVNFEANSQDIEIQEQELEKQRQLETYRRRFEEALIRIEDQEDVEAMQGAKKEMRDNDDEDGHEFDEIIEPELDDGLTEEQKQAKRNEILEAQRIKEQQAQQKINDGMSLTQGEMKKHQEIDWNQNSRINPVTKDCLNYLQGSFTF